MLADDHISGFTNEINNEEIQEKVEFENINSNKENIEDNQSETHEIKEENSKSEENNLPSITIYKEEDENTNVKNNASTEITVNSINTNQNNLIDPYENIDRIELLDYLLSFLDTDSPLNYVLASYFSKFLITLCNKHPQKVI